MNYSMPSTSHEKSSNDMYSPEARDHRNECYQDLAGSSGSMATLHQKQQKPGQLMDERHEHASQFNVDSANG
jgi:hypothetical protein